MKCKCSKPLLIKCGDGYKCSHCDKWVCKIRKSWTRRCVTKVKKSKKLYDRKQSKKIESE